MITSLRRHRYVLGARKICKANFLTASNRFKSLVRFLPPGAILTFCLIINHMENNLIETKLKEMIAERLFLNIPPQDIPTDASLIQTYGIDSVCLMELSVGLEEAFGIIIEEGDFNPRHFKSVAALRDFVKTRVS